MSGALKKSRTRAEAPALSDVVDTGHLGRYTMGDPALERDLLGMFAGQIDALRAAMRRGGDPKEWKLATHTLKGAALAVGAFPIAEAARALEEAGPSAPEAALRRLDARIAQFRAAWERRRKMV